MAGFRDLEVWKKAHELVLTIYQMAAEFPPQERFRLTDQLCRSAMSVPTNIAEGVGRHGRNEFKHFLYIARGSIEETKYLLLLGKDLGYIQDATHAKLAEEYDLVGKMLNGLINSLDRRHNDDQAPATKN
jgi:four helix bundle protein